MPVWNGYWNEDEDLNTDNVYDASEDLQSLADTFMNPNYNEINTMYFNGNDAITLESGTGIIDIFGKIGEDPGVAWGDENDRDGSRRCKAEQLSQRYLWSGTIRLP